MPWFWDLFKYLRNRKKLKKKKNNSKIREEKHVKEVPSSGILTDSNGNASDSPKNEQVEHFATYNDYVRHLQEKKIFSDVSVEIDTEKYAAYRVSLASLSGFFSDIFNMQREKPHIRIRVTGIKSVAFEVLLQYTYTGILPITPEVVSDLITMADRLRIPMIKPLVNDYIEGLPVVHALAIVTKQKLFGPLYDKTMIAACEQFNTFRLEAEFLDIDIEKILIILSSDDLNISSELDVFKAAIRWIAHNIMDRKQQLLKLMKCVRFPLMTHYELFQCNELTNLLQENKECTQMLLEANWIVASRMLGKKDLLNLMVSNPRIRTRAPMVGGHDFKDNPPIATPCQQTTSGEKSLTTGEIIAVGGFIPPSCSTAISGNSMNKYHRDDNEWKHYGDLPEPRLHFSVTIQNGTVYLTGGYDPRLKVKPPVPTSDAFIFVIKTFTWIKIMPMNTARMHHSLASLNGMVYAIGGQDGNNKVLNTVECYNPKTDNWFFVKPMSEARLAVATGVIGDKLYTAGGYGESIEKPILDTVECFDPKKNKWKSKNKLRIPRCNANIVVVNSKLYLCGGITRSFLNCNSVISSEPSIDVYNKEHDVWEHCTDMEIARHGAGTVSDGTLIYIIGGTTTQLNSLILRSVECFETDTKTWISGVKGLPYPSKWIQGLCFN